MQLNFPVTPGSAATDSMGILGDMPLILVAQLQEALECNRLPRKRPGIQHNYQVPALPPAPCPPPPKSVSAIYSFLSTRSSVGRPKDVCALADFPMNDRKINALLGI